MGFKQSIQRFSNPKFRHMARVFQSNDAFTLLDVGAGNRSASKTKSVFPNCRYYGLDIDRSTNYTEADFREMETFYELDLTLLNLSALPDGFFDYINMAHVIEHLHNGDAVLPILIQKLKPGGHFYIEYPGAKSLTLPSMAGTLNFHDDPTHVRVYSVVELGPIFEKNQCLVLNSGIRRNGPYLWATPLRVLAAWVQGKKPMANVFWDLMGFAEYLFVQRKA
ncbi:MAG: class I SAM-dependent methyltransferase [Chitinophagaceae bacterium]